MTAPFKNVKTATETGTAAGGSIAPLKNVAALMTLIETLRNRAIGLPGFGVFSGYSGFGKSVASQYAMNRTGAIYVEVREYWTKKRLCEALLNELGEIRPRGTVARMMDDIIT